MFHKPEFLWLEDGRKLNKKKENAKERFEKDEAKMNYFKSNSEGIYITFIRSSSFAGFMMRVRFFLG
jgi:hypothetical protein